MSNESPKKVEWDDLKKEGRNCLLWPDFLEWGAEDDVVVEKGSKIDDDLGIITIVLQCLETETCFNIIKQIKEGQPATGRVEQFQWITAVDNKPTTRVKESKDLIKLTKNGKSAVCLSIRRAIDPLLNIKRWGKEREVTLEVDSKDLGFRLAHFYSKVKDDIIDHILIFEVESGKNGKSKIHKQLNRGDELLLINGQSLKGKKLNDIYGLIFKSHKVVMQVIKIVPMEEYQEILRNIALKHPDQIYWRQEKNEVVFGALSLYKTLGLKFISSKNNSEKEFFHIVSKVIVDTQASGKNVFVGSRLVLVNGQNITCLKQNEAVELMRNIKEEFKLVMAVPSGIKPQPLRKKRHSLTRKNSQSDDSTSTSHSIDKCESEYGCEVSGPEQSLLVGTNGATTKMKLGRTVCTMKEQNNSAYDNSSSEERNDKLCKKCEREKTCKMLPDDKLKWSITNIDPVSLDEICRELDIEVQGTNINPRYFAGNLEFSNKDGEAIIRTHSSKGGNGTSRDLLNTWSERDQARNVGKLLDILKKIERKEAVQLLEEWISKDTCQGCGALIERSRTLCLNTLSPS